MLGLEVRFNDTDRVLSNAHAGVVLYFEDRALSIRSVDVLVHERCDQYHSWGHCRVNSELTSSVITLLLVEQLVNGHQTTSFPFSYFLLASLFMPRQMVPGVDFSLRSAVMSSFR